MRLLLILLIASLFVKCTSKNDPDKEEWIQLFNGVDLNDWHPKIRGYALDDNFGNTFRVEDSVLKVSYDQYDSFNARYGHIFYKEKFSHYRLVVEYRFTGDQAKGGEGWATRNSGAMLHCQDPATMDVDQDFPISIEGQFLGGLGTGARSTANLCTPGTNVYMADTLFTPHCISSTSKTYDGDQWVTVEMVVLGDSLIQHIVEGKVVISYSRPELSDDVTKTDLGIALNGRRILEGYISLQSESHPIEFRRVELLNLKGCNDPKAKNFKTYYVASDPKGCQF